jgi:hypothetical protein
MIDPAMLALLLVQDKGAWEAYAAQSRTRRSPPPDENQTARRNDMAPKETEQKDETATERAARYERIGKASAKTIKNMFAGTALADKLRAKGYTWVPKSKDPPKDGR